MPGLGDETVNMRDNNRKDPLPVGWLALFTPSDAMPKDRGLYAKRRLILIAVGLLVLAVCWGLGQSKPFVENIYADGFGQSVGRGFSSVSGLLPTSLAEVVIILGAGWFLFHWVRASWHVARRKRRALNAIACGGLHLVAVAVVTLALFYVLWGLNYARAPLIERQQWQEYAAALEDREAQIAELAVLCEELVEATNESYVASMGTDDYGSPSAPRAELFHLDASIDRGYADAQVELGLDESFALSRGPAKPVTLSAAMSYLQIGGFYFPWTGEANFNRLQPPCNIPFTIAHEKAHQRCITSEDEANFFGFLACIRSDDAYVQYSGYLFAQRQLLNELARLDTVRTIELVQQRHPGVQRDVDGVRQYWTQYQEGVAKQVGKVSREVNNAYLKTNGVKGGVKSYGMSAKLLIIYARKGKLRIQD